MATGGTVKIDSRGLDDMLLQLSRRTGMSFRDVVRGVSRDVLTAAARSTKQAKAKDVRKSVERVFRKPFRTKRGDKVGVTKSGLVWYQGAGWQRDNWVLLSRDGKIVSVKGTAFRTKAGAVQRSIKLSPAIRGAINSALSEARQFKSTATKYRISQIGSGKAAWVEIMRRLSMSPSSTRGLGRAMKVRLPTKHKAAVSGREASSGGDRFQVEVRSQSSASLNPRAGGVRAFSRAINGQVKRYQTAAKKDIVGYANQFASKNGFRVTG